MKQVMIPVMSEQSLATTLEIISDGIWDWNAVTGYVYRSPGWYTMLGYDIHSLENTVLTWESVIHKDDFDRVMEHFDAYITQKSKDYNIQYRCRTKQGEYIWIEDRGKVVEWSDDGSVIRMIGAHRDINAEKLLLEQFTLKNKSLENLIDERTKALIKINHELEMKVLEAQRLATTDSLTSISNRYHFEKVLNREVERAKRFSEPLSIIAIDIDHFKQVNDLYGHATGDLVLIKLTQLIKTSIREIDLLARWGGDELMVVLPNTALEEAKGVAEKLRAFVADTPINEKLNVTSSFGVAQLHKDESSMRFAIRVDQAMYKSKKSGRNVVYT